MKIQQIAIKMANDKNRHSASLKEPDVMQKEKQ